MSTIKDEFKVYLKLVRKYSVRLLPIFLIVIVSSSLYGAANSLYIELGSIFFKYMSGTDTYVIPVLNITIEGEVLLNVAILALIGITLFRSIGNFVNIVCSEYLGNRVAKDLREEIYEHYLYMKSQDYDKTDTGKLMALMSFNVTGLANALSTMVLIFFKEGITLLFLCGFLFYKNPKFASIIFTIAPIIGLIIAISGYKFRKFNTRIFSLVGNLNTLTNDVIKSQKIVKMYCSQEKELSRFKLDNQKVLKNTMSTAITKGLSMPSIQFLVSLASAGLTYIVIKYNVFATTTDLLVFVGIVAMMVNPIKSLSEIQSPIQAGVTAAHGIMSFLDKGSEKDIPSNRCLRTIDGHIEFKNVDFRYSPNGEYVLKNISFSVKPGETIALVGSSGSGKSTLMSLLMRLYDIESGSISVDGVDIRELDIQNWRSFIALVSQQNLLFNDTVVNNICYNNKMDMAKLERVINDSYSNFAYSLPAGLHTYIGDSATLVSGGQAQRIALARAFYKNSPILILDEATSSLDADSEAKIQKAVDKLKFHKTTFIIAHRLSTVKLADKILVLQHGSIVETGTHNELISQEDSIYHSLYRTQLVSSDGFSLNSNKSNKNSQVESSDLPSKKRIPWYRKLLKLH